MSEYTPSTEEVRTDYIMAYTERQSSQLLAGLAFDRWHAAELAAAEYQAWQAQARADTLRHAARDIPSAYQHGDSPSAWLNRRADEEEEP